MEERLKIFLIADTVLAGGAEWFILRLKENFLLHGHDVRLLVLRADKVDRRIIGQFSDTELVHANVSVLRLLLFADRVLNKLFGKPFLFHNYSTAWLKRKLKKEKPSVIHSHLLAADIIAVDANKETRIPHVTTIHGDYIEFLKDKREIRVKQAQKVMHAITKVVVITEEQKKYLGEHFPFAQSKLVKIYNGYELVQNVVSSQDSRHFSFGMIARGTTPKGWAYAIKAFSSIDDPKARLIFYGSGDHLDELEKVNSDKRIIFAGFTNDPLAAIATFDVGLFPSYYSSESLPTTIIEYLVLHKPVLTTPVGECVEMIEWNGKRAGDIIPMKEGVPDADKMAEQMKELMNNKDLYQQMSKDAERAKYKFEMSKCINSYLEVYKS